MGDGAGVRHWRSYDRKDNADAYHDKVGPDARQRLTSTVPAAITMQDHVNHWTLLISHTIKQRTLARYMEILGLHWLPSFAKVRVLDLDRERIELGFHPDHTGRQARYRRHQPTAFHTPAEHRMPTRIHLVQLEYLLRHIDPQCRDVYNRPSLLADNECGLRSTPPILPRVRLVWEEGWVHFISTTPRSAIAHTTI